MDIRTFQNGDEPTQAAIYNEAAAGLPGFKPATAHEVRRRTSAADFDPGSRFFALDGGVPVAYCLYNANGRVSHPWCRPGHEALAGPLFRHVLDAMTAAGHSLAFAAYRGDWPAVLDFFQRQGFARARDMVNFTQEVVDMPTIPVRPRGTASAVRREDVPAIFDLCPAALRVATPAELERHLFDNPYFTPDALFAERGRSRSDVLAVGILITEPTYADPAQLDPLMPCFRLGAFGTEGMQAKRVKGLFSFLARDDAAAPGLALDMLGQASARVQAEDDIGLLAAQVPSDVPHLLRFYERNFQYQGRFPVLERRLGA